MHVGADDRGHHGLAGEVDAARAGGRRNLARLPTDSDRAALDENRRVIDRRAAVARDDARAFEQRLRRRAPPRRR